MMPLARPRSASWRSRDESRSLADDIAALRAWAANQAPALVDSITAVGLAPVAGNGKTFPEAVKLALQFYETSGSDELLVPLLESDGAAENKPLARTLAARLTDAKKCEEYLWKFK